METVGAYEARTYFHRLLDRVARGESLTITPYGRPVARSVPVASGLEQAREAMARIVERRKQIERVPLAELPGSIHEGHRF